MQVDKMFHHILLFANTFRSLLVHFLVCYVRIKYSLTHGGEEYFT